jgi:type VI protein secretion system component VasK
MKWFLIWGVLICIELLVIWWLFLGRRKPPKRHHGTWPL